MSSTLPLLALLLFILSSTRSPAPAGAETAETEDARWAREVGAPVQDGDRTSFDAALAEAQRSLSRRRWREAEKALRALLVAHAGADYVRPHLQGLREDLRRAAFWKDVDEPEPQALIAGRLLRYTPGGSVRVRYTQENLADFEHAGQMYSHPMHFSDLWTIEIEGTPQEVAGTTYFIALAPDDGYLLRFGKREKGDILYFKHSASRVEGSVRRRLATVDPEERRGKRPTVKAKIVVGRRSIRMSYDGRRALQVDMPEDDFGSLGLLAPTAGGFESSFGEITIDGEIDRGWIGGLIDGAVADQRAAFDTRWQDPPEFGAWEELERDTTEDLTWPELFGRLKFLWTFDRPRQQELFDRAYATVGKGRAQAASTLEQIDTWPEHALPPSAFAYLRLHCALELDRPTLALDQIEWLEVTPEQALDRALLRAELLLGSGRVEEARLAFERIATDHPGTSLAYLRAAESLLFLARPEEAHRVLLRGLAELPSSDSLRQLEIKVVKASKGPSWKRVAEDRGRHFIARTDGGRKLYREARKVLDEAWERCIDFFGPLPAGTVPHAGVRKDGEPAPHSVAYLFSGEASYLAYVAGIADAGHENTLGIYSPLLKQIAAWNQPNAEGLWDTLRHEVAHRYLDLSIGERIPRWLNEGLAECFAASWNAASDFAPGGLRDQALFACAGTPLTHLRAFMTQPEEDFLARIEVGYGQAWALVHFLRFGSEADRATFDRLLAALRAGTDPQLAIDRSIEGVDMSDLEKRFFDWLNARLRGFQRRR